MTTFKRKIELTDSFRLQAKSLWLDTFCTDLDDIEPGTIDDKMGFLDETLVAILPTKGGRKIVGMACLLTPTKKDLAREDQHYQNIKRQGVREKDAYLYNLCIRVQDRRKGLASKLVGDIEEHLKMLGKERLILHVVKDNLSAVALYNKLHYRVSLATPDGFLMEKKLI